MHNGSAADKCKDGNAECEESQDDSRDRQAQRRQTVEQKEQDQTPGSNRAGHSHFILLCEIIRGSASLPMKVNTWRKDTLRMVKPPWKRIYREW